MDWKYLIQLSVEEKKEKDECDKLKNEFASVIKREKKETNQEGSLTIVDRHRYQPNKTDYDKSKNSTMLSNSGTSISLRNLGYISLAFKIC